MLAKKEEKKKNKWKKTIEKICILLINFYKPTLYLLWDTFSPPFFVGGLIILICNNVLFILFLLDLHMNSLYRNGISLISALRLLFWALNYIENGKIKIEWLL